LSGDVKVEEMSVQQRLDNSSDPDNPAGRVVCLCQIAIDPVQHVKHSISSESKNIVRSQSLNKTLKKKAEKHGKRV